MADTMEKIKALRKLTGAGVMDCKRMLADAKGDVNKAAVELQKRGLATKKVEIASAKKGAKPRKPATIQEAAELLRAQAIHEEPPSKQTVDAIAQALAHEDREVVLHAASAALYLTHPKLLAPLLGAIDHPNPYTRCKVVEALASYDAPEARGAVAKAELPVAFGELQQAQQDFSRKGAKTTVDNLVTLSYFLERYHIDSAIVHALSRKRSNKAFDALKRLAIEHPAFRPRHAAVCFLKGKKAERVFDILAEVVRNDPLPRLRSGTVRDLAALSCSEVLPLLKELARGGDTATQAPALSAIQKKAFRNKSIRADPEVFTLFFEGLSSPHTREPSLWGLELIKAPEVLDAVLQTLENEKDPGMQSVCLGTIKNIDDKGAIPALKRLKEQGLEARVAPKGNDPKDVDKAVKALEKEIDSAINWLERESNRSKKTGPR